MKLKEPSPKLTSEYDTALFEIKINYLGDKENPDKTWSEESDWGQEMDDRQVI